MAKLFTKFFYLSISILIFSSILFAQGSVEQRRQREHQAVIDYIQSHHPNYPVNPNPTKTSYLKYSGPTHLAKLNAFEDRKRYLMNGNNVTCEIWNYGGIGPGFPGANLRELLAMVWKDAPYIFQFTPLVAAKVQSETGDTVFIVSDGLYDYDRPQLRDRDPATGLWWTFEPLPGYADPNQEFMASNPAFDSDRDGKPDSWPREWYNATLGEYVWPGYLKVGENNADLEVYWAMDDRDNKEFKYYPFLNDTTRKGLGVQIDGRAFQWSNSLAANAIFFVWTITNVSDKDLDSVVFGIYGDPDVGGVDNDDDNGFFIKPFGDDVQNIPVYARSMVYFWDPDMKGDRGVGLGYLGCKFLESPGNPNDSLDNDGDGMVDERQDDGIDNDGDWNAETDDVGIDGIPNTGDLGEGDGMPTAGQRLPDGRPDPLAPGEPNFEYTDLDEADQIGLTSFNSESWATSLAIGNDADIWNRVTPGNFSEITNNEDIVFIFGSGKISLKKGESKRISMAFLFGDNLQDLLVTAETVQDIYNKNYRFFRPPDLPTLSAIPGDKKVTLIWDTKAEESIDPITGKDFEGYVIYRSTRPDFADIQKITDGRASTFLYDPLKDVQGFDAKFDLQNNWKGYHPVPYQGRGIHYYLGDDTGLRHFFVDSNNVLNGQTYYYAVVAYDHGDSLGIPPTETTKKINVDPITSQLIFDKNTVQVIPGPRASGYESPVIKTTDVLHPSGIGNGEVSFKILDDLSVIDETYTLTFSDSLKLQDTVILKKNYSVIGEKSVTESFFLFGTKFTALSHGNISNDQILQVKDKQGTVYNLGTDYIINFQKGAIRRTDSSSMPDNSEFIITYRYYPIYQSTAMKGEDSNPVFNGVKLLLNDFDGLRFDQQRSKWSRSDLNIPVSVGLSSLGAANRKTLWPADYIITFSDTYIDSAKYFKLGSPLTTIQVKYKVEEVTSGVPQRIWTILKENAVVDTAWSRGDEIIFYKPGAQAVSTDTLTWGIIFGQMTASDSSMPRNGDQYYFYTQRPFSTSDVFKLSTKAGSVNNELAKSRLDNIYVVPNPYVGANEIEPGNRLPDKNRGERRIYFENLPPKCTIRIFTLSGELVTTLEHDSGSENGREFWNLLNRDGFSVAYGIYLAHIDAPGIGEKLIKFALIK
ncbi:MAG: hypothetical protein ACUVT3_00645 [Ignavibacterium sp.]